MAEAKLRALVHAAAALAAGVSISLWGSEVNVRAVGQLPRSHVWGRLRVDTTQQATPTIVWTASATMDGVQVGACFQRPATASEIRAVRAWEHDAAGFEVGTLHEFPEEGLPS